MRLVRRLIRHFQICNHEGYPAVVAVLQLPARPSKPAVGEHGEIHPARTKDDCIIFENKIGILCHPNGWNCAPNVLHLIDLNVVCGAISARIFSKSRMLTSLPSHWAIPVVTPSVPPECVCPAYGYPAKEIRLMWPRGPGRPIYLVEIRDDKQVGTFGTFLID